MTKQELFKSTTSEPQVPAPQPLTEEDMAIYTEQMYAADDSESKVQVVGTFDELHGVVTPAQSRQL